MPSSLSLFLERGQGLPHLSFTICSGIKAAYPSLLSAQDVFTPLLNHYAPAWPYLRGRIVTRIEKGHKAKQPGPAEEPGTDLTTPREGLLKREGMSSLSLGVCKQGWIDLWASCREE